MMKGEYLKCPCLKSFKIIVYNVKEVFKNQYPFFISCRGSGGLASILKDTDVKFNKEEQSLTCCVLCTADYCLDTTQQVKGYLGSSQLFSLIH